MPTELRRHLETKKMRQATPYNQWIGLLQNHLLTWWENNQVDLEAFAAALHTWDNFIVNLGNEGRGLRTAHAFLSQDLQMTN